MRWLDCSSTYRKVGLEDNSERELDGEPDDKEEEGNVININRLANTLRDSNNSNPEWPFEDTQIVEALEAQFVWELVCSSIRVSPNPFLWSAQKATHPSWALALPLEIMVYF